MKNKIKYTYKKLYAVIWRSEKPKKAQKNKNKNLSPLTLKIFTYILKQIKNIIATTFSLLQTITCFRRAAFVDLKIY